MGTSKNDTQKNGGIIRILHNSDHGKKIVSVKIINPDTNCPLTYDQINNILENRRETSASSLREIDVYQEMIRKKIERHPDAEFVLSRTRDTKEEADKALRNEVMPEIDKLTMILFQPYQINQSMTGVIDLRNFYHFQESTLFNGYPKSTQLECRCAMNTVILPVLGDITLKELENTAWVKLKKQIDRKLIRQKAGESKCRYCRRALDKLYGAVQQYNQRAAVNLMLISNSVRIITKNTDIRQAFTPNHMDDVQRQQFFQKVQQLKNRDYLMFALACIYMGISLELLACHTFGDIQLIHTADGGHIYSLLINKSQDKNQKTIDVTSEAVPLKSFRIIMFSPWAAKFLVNRVEQLHQNGYQKTKDLPLSTSCPGEPAITDVEAILCGILSKINGVPIKIPREDKTGGARIETVQIAFKLIREDASYVLTELCKANEIMRHLSFGETQNTVDEKYYLDTFSPQYTVHRYYVQSRWNPFSQEKSKINQYESSAAISCRDRYHQAKIHVKGSAENQKLYLNGKFAFYAKWEELK